MSRIAVAGAGAFGTALAVVLARAGHALTLWARSPAALTGGESPRLPGIALPANITVTGEPAALAGQEAVLLAVPMQALGGFLGTHGAALEGQRLVACCKGVDLASGAGPTALITQACPGAVPAVLTGPSFAADIARGLPTALTLACACPQTGAALQALLSTPSLRIYRSTDITGAELGGAVKNVIAIAAGIVIGAGLGESARAALITRGFAEMQRLALARGAQPETLAGLSGLGDLVLTCGSAQSRNFAFGLALGRGAPPEAGVTVEGAATARALARAARGAGLDLPITAMVAAVLDTTITVDHAVRALMARPLKEE